MDLKHKLIDHIIVMGIDLDKHRITNKALQSDTIVPSILELYPTLQEKVPIPRYLDNFHLWTFENGFKIYDQNLCTIYGKEDKFLSKSAKNNAKNTVNEGIESKNKLYSFVMTDENSCKRYCTTLLFHEPYFLRTDEKNQRKRSDADSERASESQALIYVPKSISVVSTLPCLEAQRALLKAIFGDLLHIKGKKYCSRNIKIPTRYIWNLGYLIKDLQENNIVGEDANVDRHWEKLFDYNRDQHFKALGKEEEIQLNETILREFYISALFSLMNIPKNPIERMVLKLHNEDENPEFVRYRTIKRVGIYYPHIDYKMLFRRLSARNIVRVLKYVLLEKQIIFFSSRPEEIPFVTEAFLSLVAPLNWCCLYVPFLPFMMWEILHAVMPYIVGVCSKYKEFVASQIDLTDKIVVDLDDDALFIGEDNCEFPKEPMNYLTKKLEEVSQACKKTNWNAPRTFWMDITLRARQHLNIAIMAIMNNYLSFFKYKTKKQGAPAKNRGSERASEIFQLNEYFAQFSKYDVAFMREFSSTMMFINFIEESYLLIYSDKNSKNEIQPENIDEISHFIEQLKETAAFSFSDPELSNDDSTYLKLLHPKAIEHIEVVNSDTIKQIVKQHTHLDTIDLLPYLLKYYFRFFLSQKDRIKLLSSPLSFKTTSTVGESPEIQSPDSLNKDIRYYTPLDKTKIVDLNNVFQSSSPSKSNPKLHVSSPHERRHSHTMPIQQKVLTESPKLPSPGISVQIDYMQLEKITEAQRSPGTISRFSLSKDLLPQSTPATTTAATHARRSFQNTSISHLEGFGEGPSSLSPQFRGEGRKSEISLGEKSSREILSYNTLHIPRKGSGPEETGRTSLNSMGRLPDSSILQGGDSRTSSGKKPIFHRKEVGHVEGQDWQEEMKKFYGRTGSDKSDEREAQKVNRTSLEFKSSSMRKEEEESVFQSPVGNKKKIFENKDKYSSYNGNYGGSEGRLMFDDIDFKKRFNE